MTKTLAKKCFHCGENCPDTSIQINKHFFCCNGCKSVYSILNQNKLTAYYCLNEAPGKTAEEFSTSKFNFLDDDSVATKILSFKNNIQSNVSFYLPHIHCSSCLWLLENLNKLNQGIISSEVNFNQKILRLSFEHDAISLKEIAILLSSIGYEPYISLQDYEQSAKPVDHRKAIVKLGIAGFCFMNIMLISFPEYLGLEFSDNQLLSSFFRYTNLLLSIPVIFYCAQEFFINACSSLKQRFINIDAPIALAISITFIRSIYEIITMTGPGYLDSMSGIVFFMLLGRFLQQRTATYLKFNRDYKSYFPISLTVKVNDAEINKNIHELVEGDIIKLRHQEIVPVDGILMSKKAEIDYSFVTGENNIISLKSGDLIYAGGKIQNTSIEIITAKVFSQSYFTALWNNPVFSKAENTNTFIETISKYFSLCVLLIASASFIYWQIYNPMYSWNALTAVLIVACPCTLLLASSYSFGFMIELFSKEGMFVKNFTTINKMSKVNHLVFDKTGTLSDINHYDVKLFCAELSKADLSILVSLMQHSTHPLSNILSRNYSNYQTFEITNFKESVGYGIEAWYNERHIKIGNAEFTGIPEANTSEGATIYFSFNGKKNGYFVISTILKSGIRELLLEARNYKLSLLSGDNHSSLPQMKQLFPETASLLFKYSPQDKLNYIKCLQVQGDKVLMIGDGMNDAGALKQSDIGIAVVDKDFTFAPASDAILNSSKISDLLKFIKCSKMLSWLIISSFIYSLLYNIIGLSFAVSAHLQPVVAAILMPASSITVILISYFGTMWIYRINFTNK